MGFREWFWENLYSNCFTIATVIMSGLISWIISTIYYRMGNRDNLKISVILPIIELLQGSYTKENYALLCKISGEYSVKYLRKEENRILSELKSAYKDVYLYDENLVYANILFSYFEDKLKKNDIDINPVPVIINDEVVDHEPPQDWFELQDDLERQLNIFDPNYQPEECQEAVNNLFRKYCKQHYSSKDVEFFNELCLEKILAQSELNIEWKQKFITMGESKERFLNLNIVRKILTDNPFLLNEKRKVNTSK